MNATKTAASVAAATAISATIPPRPKAAIRVTRRRFQGAWPLARSPRGARAWVRVRRVSRPLSSRRSEEHTSELQSRQYLVCRLLLEKKKKHNQHISINDYYLYAHCK